MTAGEKTKTRLEDINIMNIKRSPYQPRKTFSKTALITRQNRFCGCP